MKGTKDCVMAYIGLLLIGIIGFVCDRMPGGDVATAADPGASGEAGRAAVSAR
jgi:hypothetical protein